MVAMNLESNKNNKQHLLQALSALSQQHLEMSEVSLFDQFACHAIQQYLDKDYLNRPLETIFWNLYGLFRVVSNSEPYSLMIATFSCVFNAITFSPVHYETK